MSENIEQQLSREGYYVSTTVGMSMYPMLRNRRDRVIIFPLEKGERLKKYDLPLYHRPDGKYILHRVIAVRDGYYLIRGDNTYIIEKVPDSWVLGKVTEFYRGERHILSTSRGYAIYIRFWRLIYPLRFVFVKIKRFMEDTMIKVRYRLARLFKKDR